jgi:hypothetical protein
LPRLEPLEDRTLPSTVTWINPAGGDWNTPGNWSTNALPGPSDDVVIDVPKVTVTITHSSGTHTIQSLTSNESLTLSGGALTVTGAVQVSATFTLSGATLAGTTVLAGTTIKASGAGGTLDGVTLNGDLDLTARGSRVAVKNGLTLNGTATLGGASSYAELDFQGTQTLGGGGTVVLAGPGYNDGFGNFYADARYLQTASMTLTVGPSLTIRGQRGGLGYAATNAQGGPAANTALVLQGAVNADVADTNGLVVNTSSWSSSGALAAQNGGTLTLQNAGSSGGSLQAISTGSQIVWQGSYTFTAGARALADAGGQIKFQATFTSSGQGIALLGGTGSYLLSGTGTAATPVLLEAPSVDGGNTAAGFTRNFALGLLSLSGNSFVRLIDNQRTTAGTAPEAVYANSLVVSAGSRLDLNRVHTYARAAQVDGTIIGGSLAQLPDSGPISLNNPTPGVIAQAGELDEWTFFARAGRLVTVVVNPGSAASPAPLSPTLAFASVRVLDAGGNALAAGSSTSSGAVVVLSGVAFPADGTYRVQVQAASGHSGNKGNYIVGVWDATINVAPVLLNEPTVGVLETPYTADRWTFSASAGTQVRFHLINALSNDFAFALTGPNGYTGFTGLTADSDLLTLPAEGTYTLQVTPGGLAVGGYAFSLLQTSVTDLPLNTTYNGTIPGSGAAQLFRANVPVSQQLLITLQDNVTGDHNEVYLKYGSAPTRADYQYRFSTLASADQSVLVPSAAPGDWYILLYADYVSTHGTLPSYFLTASGSSMAVSGGSPRIGNGGTVVITGAGFTPSTTVSLVGEYYNGSGWSPVVIPATTVVVNSPTRITATFPSLLARTGFNDRYTVRASRPDGTNADAPIPYLVEGRVYYSGQKLEAHVVVPNLIGYHIASTIYVEYSNVGITEMPAPVLVLTATQNGKAGALLTLDASKRVSGFWTSATPDGYSQSVQILASGAVPGFLEPGESVTIPVYYAGWLTGQWDFSRPPIIFNLGALDAQNSQPVDWTSLKDSLRPPSLSQAIWNALYPNLTAQLGATWGSYV